MQNYRLFNKDNKVARRRKIIDQKITRFRAVDRRLKMAPSMHN